MWWQRIILLVITLSLPIPISVAAEDDIFSGPQPGERLPPLKVRNVFADPVVELDPATAANGRPLLLLFVHKRERPAFGLMNVLLRYSQTRRTDGLNSAAVFLATDLTETANWMRRIRKYFPQEATVTVSPDGIEGPGSYGLNRDVTLTVLIAKDDRVTANFALVQPSLQADGPKIAKAIVKVLGGGEVPDLVKFSNQRMQQMRRPAERNANGRTDEQDPRLTSLLRRVIQKDAEAEQVAATARELNAYLEKNAAARKRVGEIAARIIAAGKLENYGTKVAQEHLKSWAKKFGPKRPDGKPARRSGQDNDSADNASSGQGQKP
jgi:hypothetical protein